MARTVDHISGGPDRRDVPRYLFRIGVAGLIDLAGPGVIRPACLPRGTGGGRHASRLGGCPRRTSRVTFLLAQIQLPLESVVHPQPG
jgi:hypothetical protein